MIYDKYNMYVKEEFTKHFDKNKIETIFEIGAREGLYTIELLDYYTNCKTLHSFECNPHTVNECISRTSNDKRVIFNNMAVSDKIGSISFHPCRAGNEFGSSSQFYCASDAWAYLSEINNIPCNTLDNYCITNNINHIDLLLIDIEGGELNAFKGASNILKNTDIIIAEVWENPKHNIKEGCKADIINYLKQYGFNEKYSAMNDMRFGDSLFIKQ